MNNIYKCVKIVFLLSIWHESGSRVIQESYSNGIPVICFNTGGNIEFIKQNKSDIFESPETYNDRNNKLRIKYWNCEKIFLRICSLIDNENNFIKYSEIIMKESNLNYKKYELRNNSEEITNFLKI